jgi:phosphoserine aminotransferase
MSNPPGVRPVIPHFSSGPCAKRPGWSLQALTDAVLGRSHRSKIGKAKLKRAIDLTREVLEAPADYRIGIVPASDTGAVEMALWSLLGPRPVTMLAWESVRRRLGRRRPEGAQAQEVTVMKAPYGQLPDLAKVDSNSDVVFTWNGTTSGARVPNADWIKADRQGLTICDADVGRLRAAARLEQARCRDLLLAEGARRRSRARHDRAVAARSGAARKLYAAVAAAEDFPHDQGRQAQRGNLRGRHHQHAVDAVRRGLSRHAQLGQVGRRVERADRRAPTPTPARSPMGGADAVDRFLARPAIRPTPRSASRWSIRRCEASADAQAKFVKGIAAALEKEGIAYDIEPTATRRRACASGAARPSRRPTSRR